MLTQADLPDDIDALRALVLEQSRMLAEERTASEVRLAELNVAKGEADAEIERLQSIIKAFMRHRFGSRSEQLDADQLQLGLEDVEAALGRARAVREAVAPRSRGDQPRKTNRGSLPAHLDRIEQIVDIEEKACPCCSGTLHQISEDVAERLLGHRKRATIGRGATQRGRQELPTFTLASQDIATRWTGMMTAYRASPITAVYQMILLRPTGDLCRVGQRRSRRWPRQ